MGDNRIDDLLDGIDDDGLADIAAAIQALDVDDRELLTPPDEVWDGIAASLADEDDHDRHSTHVPADRRTVTPVTSTPTVSSISERRRRLERQTQRRSVPRSMLMAAAAVIVVVAAVGAYVVTRTSTADTIAEANLAYDPTAYDQLGENAVASVRLVDDEGALRIEFEEASLPASELGDEDLELWLLQIDDDGELVDLVSLGVVDDIDRRYAVPEGYSTDDYSVVDISVEPRDGVEQHSGRTILRGELSA